jgi:hypothetical protein
MLISGLLDGEVADMVEKEGLDGTSEDRNSMRLGQTCVGVLGQSK